MEPYYIINQKMSKKVQIVSKFKVDIKNCKLTTTKQQI